MFCLEENHGIKNYTLINNVFFTQILNNVPMEYLSIYLLGYFYSANPSLYSHCDNETIASKLNIPVEKVLETWDFLEKLNLIKKHNINNFTNTDYYVEFVDLNVYKSNEPSKVKSAIYNVNEPKAAMYKKIEEIIGRPLAFYETKSVENFLKVHDIPYNIVVDACASLVFDKNSKDINKMLEILDTWIKDGIKSTNDLDEYLSQKKTNYSNYRKILHLMGEIRTPTAPEKDLMNKWLYEYNFDLEVIELAITKSLNAKSPTLKYIDGILTNWYNEYQKTSINEPTRDELNSYYKQLCQIITFPRGQIEDNVKNAIKFLYENYPIETVKTAVNYMKFNNETNNKPINIFSVTDFLISNQKSDTSYTTIKLKDLKSIVDKKTAKRKPSNFKKYSPKPDEEKREYDPSELPFIDPSLVNSKQLDDFLTANASLYKNSQKNEDDEK